MICDYRKLRNVYIEVSWVEYDIAETFFFILNDDESIIGLKGSNVMSKIDLMA